MLVVDKVCGTEVKIQVGSETSWTDQVVQRQPTTGTEVRRENPKPGAAYFVTVPRGKKLKVLCPSGTDGDKCIVRVANLSSRPRQAISVTPPNTPLTPTCGGWTEAKLYNLWTKPALVRVLFTQVCHDVNNPPRAPEVRMKRIVPPNLDQQTGLPAATAERRWVQVGVDAPKGQRARGQVSRVGLDVRVPRASDRLTCALSPRHAAQLAIGGFG